MLRKASVRPSSHVSLLLALTCVRYVLGTTAIQESAVFYGHPLNPGEPVAMGKRSALLRGMHLPRGTVTAFHAYMTGLADVRFQLWRPAMPQTDPETFTLFAEQTYRRQTRGRVDMAPEQPIHVEDGDFLGFYNDGLSSSGVVGSFDPVAGARTILSSVGVQPQPRTGGLSSNRPIKFDSLPFNYVFSIGISIKRTELTETALVIGATGPTGATGLRGEPGDVGATGPSGRVGASGAAGDPGFPGVKGNQGPAAIVGDTGYQGPAGLAGATGATGLLGPKGSNGTQGVQGATGKTGPNGVAGVQGGTGHTGPAGATGGRGHPGPPGPSYHDANECLDANRHGCQHGCVNELGGYRCTCRKGYQLHYDGRTCSDMNECAVNNGDCTETCENMAGSYRCHCPQGTRLGPDRHSCQDVLECARNQGGCSSTEQCIETYGSHYCIVKTLPSSPVLVSVTEKSVAAQPAGGSDPVEPTSPDNLLNRDVAIGILIWLIILTLLVLSLIAFFFIRRARDDREKDMYFKYVHLLRNTPNTQC